MAVVTSDFLAGLMTNFQAIFRGGLETYNKELGLYKDVTTRIPVTTSKVSLAWLGAPPGMSEWKDQRIFHGLGSYDYTLTPKHWEATIEVDRDTLEDDEYGMITPRIQGLARRAIQFYNEKVLSQLDDGATLLAYDGAAMFADTRVIGNSANIDNLLSGAYSGSAAEVRTALGVAIKSMRKYQDDQGKPLNLVPDTIVCSPDMEMVIREALRPAIAGVEQATRGYFKEEKIIVTPWVDATVLDWFVLCTTAEVKPLILLDRKAAEFVALDDPKSDHVFKQRTFLYGVDNRFTVAYGDPRTAIKISDA